MLAVSAEGSKGRRRLVFGSDAIHPCTMLQDSAHRARSVTVCTLCEYVLQAAERSQQRRGSKIPESSIICRLLRGGMCARANPWTDPRLFWAIPTSYVRKGVVPKYQVSMVTLMWCCAKWGKCSIHCLVEHHSGKSGSQDLDLSSIAVSARSNALISCISSSSSQFSDMAKLPTMSTVSDVDVLVSAHVQQEWISASKNISTKAQTNSCDGVIYM